MQQLQPLAAGGGDDGRLLPILGMQCRRLPILGCRAGCVAGFDTSSRFFLVTIAGTSSATAFRFRGGRL
jgi:hypothetical protein